MSSRIDLRTVEVAFQAFQLGSESAAVRIGKIRQSLREINNRLMDPYTGIDSTQLISKKKIQACEARRNSLFGAWPRLRNHTKMNRTLNRLITKKNARTSRNAKGIFAFAGNRTVFLLVVSSFEKANGCVPRGPSKLSLWQRWILPLNPVRY